MNTAAIHDEVSQSLAGTVTFPQVIAILQSEGVESYNADLVKLEKTFYMPDGETHVEALAFSPLPIGDDFSESEVVSALRAIQAKEIQYQEFLRRIMTAGTSRYIVFLKGRKVIYIGRKGEFYVEPFPQPK